MLVELGPTAHTPQGESRRQLLKVDLTDAAATAKAVRQADPDLVSAWHHTYGLPAATPPTAS